MISLFDISKPSPASRNAEGQLAFLQILLSLLRQHILNLVSTFLLAESQDRTVKKWEIARKHKEKKDSLVRFVLARHTIRISMPYPQTTTPSFLRLCHKTAGSNRGRRTPSYPLRSPSSYRARGSSRASSLTGGQNRQILESSRMVCSLLHELLKRTTLDRLSERT